MKRKEENVLKEIVEITKLLKKSRSISKEELCSTFNLEPKSIERRLKKIKETQTNYYLKSERNKGYQLIPRNTDFKATKDKVSRTRINKSDKTIDGIYDTATKRKIKIIDKAITQKGVILIHYKPGNGKPASDKRILPLKLIISESPIVLAIYPESVDTGVRTFNLSRIEDITWTHERSEIQVNLDKGRFDDFGIFFWEGAKIFNVELLLTTHSSEMIVHDFSRFRQRIMHLPRKYRIAKEFNKRVYEYDYKLTLDVSEIGLYAIARMITGMLAHVIVNTKDETIKTRLREYIKENFINALDKNI